MKRTMVAILAGVIACSSHWDCSKAMATEPTATPADSLKTPDGFHVELLYSVPNRKQGSWVSMCVDPKGRLIVSNQSGGLYRVTLPAIDASSPIQVEKVDVDIGGAQGLCWAFDSLYVVVNWGGKHPSGLYRVHDSNNDDRLDTVELLRKIDGGGEHGPHAVLLAPDGQSLYVVCGDATRLPDFESSHVPRVWDEDLLLPRPYGLGFMKGTPAPGGFISRVDQTGKRWELVAVGFRNVYDADFTPNGELFTFDADMEGDINLPWYRPTRICHVVSGADFGWRNGGGKWPVYYPDSLPPTLDIGPGSPTGICFGFGARFPAEYQKTLFVNDWSYGKLYAVHLRPQGASYSASFEEFLSGTPLPLTDIVINPLDRAMYFIIGGRGVQSGLYRVTYRGREPTQPVDRTDVLSEPCRLRHELEALHRGDHPAAVAAAWPYLNHPDRFVRHAARIAIEHRPISEWQARALTETNPQASITALLALVRQFPRAVKGTGDELDTPPPSYPSEDSASRDPLQSKVLAALARCDWSSLTMEQRIELLRVYALTFVRLGPPDESTRQRLIKRFDSVFPAKSREVNSELTEILVYLQASTAAARVIRLLAEAPTQEEQIDYVKSLRHLRAGWTLQLREAYFQWFAKATGYRGGAGLALFIEHMKDDAVSKLTGNEKLALRPILEATPAIQPTPISIEPRPFVKNWTLNDLESLIATGLRSRNFEHGRRMFSAASCFACHRFDNEGGAVGPDLTSLSGRFSPREILESIVDPSKVISDQYAAVQIATVDGKVIVGRIVNLLGDMIRVNTNMLDPNEQVEIKRGEIEEMRPSKTSMMPTGLLNSLNEQEILDLLAYLLSRGDQQHPMFTPTGGQ